MSSTMTSFVFEFVENGQDGQVNQLGISEICGMAHCRTIHGNWTTKCLTQNTKKGLMPSIVLIIETQSQEFECRNESSKTDTNQSWRNSYGWKKIKRQMLNEIDRVSQFHQTQNWLNQNECPCEQTWTKDQIESNFPIEQISRLNCDLQTSPSIKSESN
mgnify:CR=1 FL=1